MGSENVNTAHPAVNATSPDEQLVQHCLNGSEEAWSALIDKYRNLIFSIPVKLGLSNDEAQDIFQEVCLTLLSKLPQLREPRTLAAWLIKITAHECSHRRGKQFRHRLVEGGIITYGHESSVTFTEKMTEELEREQRLREAVSELPIRCRQMIQLLFFSATPVLYEEVASCLGIAKGSIGFIRARCLKRLRRLLEEKGF
jgi:RNA polymerase sigma factor (sigma-70 family)